MYILVKNAEYYQKKAEAKLQMEVIDLTSDAEPEVILQAEPCEPIDLTFDEEDDLLDDPGEPVYLALDAETANFSEDSNVDGDLDDGSKYLNEENSRKITSFLFKKMKEWEEKIKQQRRPTRYAKGVLLNSQHQTRDTGRTTSRLDLWH